MHQAGLLRANPEAYGVALIFIHINSVFYELLYGFFFFLINHWHHIGSTGIAVNNKLYSNKYEATKNTVKAAV